jgi:metal-responsive CopG/Arc/MetJ family transcriptional regulator
MKTERAKPSLIRRLSVSLDAQLVKKVRLAAIDNEGSVSSIIEAALREFFATRARTRIILEKHSPTRRRSP